MESFTLWLFSAVFFLTACTNTKLSTADAVFLKHQPTLRLVHGSAPLFRISTPRSDRTLGGPIAILLESPDKTLGRLQRREASLYIQERFAEHLRTLLPNYNYYVSRDQHPYVGLS